ncbi:tetratricopeptide repeat protein [Calothrix sp. UHCC 0171]|uniref:tetratricopeptide repeat protein n=1 Tax=Calothrix sp. UHCC 0171 TaxID=3110245 RepID=UPI002B1ED77C|nr:tetratricopeptide repeat protein [Calothrix sp. UHCC 0171]MEA5571356.1 tetratricopeptide repeat protein [Calothrix sp. UHCC 0171]
MQIKSQSKSVFTTHFYYLTLGILSVCLASSSVSAISTFSNQTTPSSGILISQLSESEQSERTQLIQTANSQMQSGNLTGAEENLRQLVKKFPKDAFGHYQLGNVLLRQEKPENAIASFQEATRLNPRYALAYNGMGISYASQEKWDDAITQFRKALEINPEYGDALMFLGQVLLQVNKRDEGVASLNKALNIFKQQNRNERVKRIENILRKLKPTDDPSISYDDSGFRIAGSNKI